MYCPTQDDNRGALLALTPLGRAWRNNDGPPDASSAVYQFWNAAASVFTFLTDRVCALALEFFCATQTETHDLWMAEYGLPDACDPFPDLCTKVSAIGGTRCEYYAAIAARAGWSITCIDANESCGASAGCGYAGAAQTGTALPVSTIQIVVNLGNSPAYQVSTGNGPFAGAMEAGFALSCSADTTPLQCIMERIVHAEINVVYTLVIASWAFAGAVVDFDFANNRYFGGTLADLSVTRGSVGYAQNLDGTWLQFANNAARISSKGLLIEEARTNVIANGACAGAVAPATLPTGWGATINPTNALNGVTATVVGSGSAAGRDYLDIRWQGTGTANNTFSNIFQIAPSTGNAAACANGQTWTHSVGLSVVGGSTANIADIYHGFDLFDGSNNYLATPLFHSVAPSIAADEKRFAGTVTLANASAAKLDSSIGIHYDAGAVVDITLRISWPQLEQGAFATSPIRTTSGAATRAADIVIANSGMLRATLCGPASASVYMAAGGTANPNAGGGVPMMLDASNAANRNLLYVYYAAARVGNWNGTDELAAPFGSGAATGSTAVALAFNATSRSLAANGTLSSALTGFSLAVGDVLSLGARWGGTDFYDGYIQRIAAWNYKLDDAPLRALTGP